MTSGDEATRATPRPVSDLPTQAAGHSTPGSASSARRAAPMIPGIVISAELGRGGMGAVYRGRQDYLGRDVAVKVLAVEPGPGAAAFVERFRREAQLLAALDHPHIVRCYEAGVTAAGECYLVMELVQGGNLRERLARTGRLSSCEALRVGQQLAEALAHAYEKGIIHRDVKPENLLLADTDDDGIGRVKLVDLGLARPQRPQGAMALTLAGMVLGTPTTMAPEQFDDPDGVDFRADIYGLGCVLFEALTGRGAYTGATFTDLIGQKKSGVVPDPSALVPGLDPALVKLVRDCLQPDRTARPASYAELLARFAALRSGPATTMVPRRRGGSFLLAAVLLLVVGGGGVVWWQYESSVSTTSTNPNTPSEPVPIPVDESPHVATGMTIIEAQALFARTQFAAPVPLWNADYGQRQVGWQVLEGAWSPSEDLPAMVGQGRAALLHAWQLPLPCKISGTIDAIDLGPGASPATEFGVLVRDASGIWHGVKISNLGAAVFGFWARAEQLAQIEVDAAPQSLPAGTLLFELRVQPGFVVFSVGGVDFGVRPVQGACDAVLLFNRGGAVQFADLSGSTALTP